MQFIKTTALALALTVIGANGFAASGEESLETRFRAVKSATMPQRIPGLAQLLVEVGAFDNVGKATEAILAGGGGRAPVIRATIGQAQSLEDLVEKLHLQVSLVQAGGKDSEPTVDSASAAPSDADDDADTATTTGTSLTEQLKALFSKLETADAGELGAELKNTLAANRDLLENAFRTLEEAESAKAKSTAATQRAEELQARLEGLAGAAEKLNQSNAMVQTLRDELNQAQEAARQAKAAALKHTEDQANLARASERVKQLEDQLEAAQAAAQTAADAHAAEAKAIQDTMTQAATEAANALAAKEAELVEARNRVAELEAAAAAKPAADAAATAGAAYAAELEAAKEAARAAAEEREAAKEALNRLTAQFAEVQDRLANAEAAYNGSKAILGLEGDDAPLTPQALAMRLEAVRDSILGATPEAAPPAGDANIIQAIDRLADVVAENITILDSIQEEILKNPGNEALGQFIRDLFAK